MRTCRSSKIHDCLCVWVCARACVHACSRMCACDRKLAILCSKLKVTISEFNSCKGIHSLRMLEDF